MDKSTYGTSTDLERRLRDKSAFDHISQALTAKLDLDQLLDTIHLQLTQLLHVDNFYVALFDSHYQEIWYPLAVKNGLRQNWPRRPLADRLTDRVILTGQPILLPQNAMAMLSRIGLPSGEDAPHAWIGIPLITSSQTIGCLALFSNSPDTNFTEDDLDLLNSLSGQTSTAIQVALQKIFLSNNVPVERDRLAIVLNSVHEGIAFIEMDGRITLANLALEAITGYTQRDFLGMPINELPEAVIKSLGFEPSESGEIIPTLLGQWPQAINKTMIRSGGGTIERFLERTIHPILGQTNQHAGWLLILRDVSEEQRARNNRDLINETLIHDLRSPISAVLSAVDVIEDAIDGNDPTGIIKPSLQIARRSAQRVLDMIESLLEIARFQAGKIELHLSKCNLRELVEQTLVEFSRQAYEYQINLVNDVPKDTPIIQIDQPKIIRVLTNLVDNAIKFTPAQGDVEISAEIVDHQFIQVRVRDSGPGIPAEYLEKIFERFGQIPNQPGRKRGSGLGLTYCRMAVEAHSGRIWVESQVGLGSTFCFVLPIDNTSNPLKSSS